MLNLQEKPQGIQFKITVRPRSSKNVITGLQGDALKVKLTAPPVEGAANKALIGFLAKSLDIPKARLTITSGQSSKTKQILVAFYGSQDKKKELNQIRKKIQNFISPAK
jgi:uncharacterized protein (TIGR00251 family)